MRNIAIGFIVISTFLTVGLTVLYFRSGMCTRTEGFADQTMKERIDKATGSANNILLDVIQKAKRVSNYVSNPLHWKERLSLATMSPIELARKHLVETMGNKPKV
jgi:hypothetical protein